MIVEPWTEQPHSLLFDSMKDAAPAHDDDQDDQRRQAGSQADSQRSNRMRILTAGKQAHDADCNERVLREERQQKLDHDACAGRGAVYSLLHQEPEADDLTAHIGDGKQTIDGLPDTGDQKERRKTDAPQNDRTPPQDIEQQRQCLQRHEQKQFPARNRQETRDRSRTQDRDERDHHAQSQSQRDLNTDFHAVLPRSLSE
jgi:hypothetical protein